MKQDILSTDFLESYEVKQQEEIVSVPTGLPTLNRICRDDGGGGGFAQGWFVSVGANPGFGKSALALNMASAALNHGVSVGYISLEMSAQQLATRLYSLHTNTKISKLERGGFTELVWRDARRAMQGSPPLWVPTNLLSTWKSVVDYCKACYDDGCRYFVLDYLQLVQLGDEDAIYRATQRIVTELRAWAVENQCTIVCLSQFNRTTSGNYDSTPRSQGLFGGMILEASSDLVLLLDHSRYERHMNSAMTYLCAAKNRHGPTIEIPIEWDYRTLSVREGDPHEEHLWPE